MAEALLAATLHERGIAAHVSSAGRVSEGQPATDTAVDTMAERGLDISGHRSRRMSAPMLAQADLIVAMTREHLREAAVLHPDCYGRTFTLKELVRRGAHEGPRAPGESLDDWLVRLHKTRRPIDHLGSSAVDDVADPVGQEPHVYEQTAVELEGLTTGLADLLWPPER